MSTDTKTINNGVEDWWDKAFRSALALAVVGLSAICMLVIAVITYWGGDENKRLVFSTLVPVLATWVGTVLAFYFSRENFKAASEAASNLVDRLSPEQRLAQSPVRNAMKPRAAIKNPPLNSGSDDTGLTIGQLLEFVDTGYSRVLVFAPGDIIKYVVHESTLTKFITDRLRNAPDTGDPLQETLGTMLASDVKTRETATRFVFVKEGGTLADARAAMLAVKGCEDVFVTKNGKPDEPVLGWLTNTDITRDL